MATKQGCSRFWKELICSVTKSCLDVLHSFPLKIWCPEFSQYTSSSVFWQSHKCQGWTRPLSVGFQTPAPGSGCKGTKRLLYLCISCAYCVWGLRQANLDHEVIVDVWFFSDGNWILNSQMSPASRKSRQSSHGAQEVTLIEMPGSQTLTKGRTRCNNGYVMNYSKT